MNRRTFLRCAAGTVLAVPAVALVARLHGTEEATLVPWSRDSDLSTRFVKQYEREVNWHLRQNFSALRGGWGTVSFHG